MEEKIVLTDDEGNEVEMYVVEETRINNVNYILVTEEEDEEEEAEISQCLVELTWMAWILVFAKKTILN